MRGGRIDFEKVFERYDNLIALAGGGKVNLSLVMPDVIGDQVATLALLHVHILRIRGYIDAGVRVLIPAQVGGGVLSLADLHNHYRSLFGDEFVFAIPSKADAADPGKVLSFVTKIKPRAIHLLGLGENKKTSPYLKLLRSVSPQTEISIDSVWHRSKVGEGRPITEFRHFLLDSMTDDTEMYASLFVDGWVPSEKEFNVFKVHFPAISFDEMNEAAERWCMLDYLIGMCYGDQDLDMRIRRVTRTLTEMDCGSEATMGAVEHFSRLMK